MADCYRSSCLEGCVIPRFGRFASLPEEVIADLPFLLRALELTRYRLRPAPDALPLLPPR